MNSYQVQSTDCQLQVYETGMKHDQMIMFLHGGPGSGAAPIMELPAFRALQHIAHCLYFDQRGSGQSLYDLRKGVSQETLCEDVARIVEDSKQRFHPKSIALWGGSFGGMLACMTIEIYPNLVDRLILTNPAITFGRQQALAFLERTAEPMKKR